MGSQADGSVLPSSDLLARLQKTTKRVENVVKPLGTILVRLVIFPVFASFVAEWSFICSFVVKM